MGDNRENNKGLVESGNVFLQMSPYIACNEGTEQEGDLNFQQFGRPEGVGGEQR